MNKKTKMSVTMTADAWAELLALINVSADELEDPSSACELRAAGATLLELMTPAKKGAR
jgi:hypothetical protein